MRDSQARGVLPPASPVRGVIWHFSDLHFPPDPIVLKDDKVLVSRERFEVVDPFERLISYVYAPRERRWCPADFLVFSGDFVDGGAINRKDKERKIPRVGETPAPDASVAKSGKSNRRSAFEQAANLVSRLAFALNVPTENVIVCPGNHDVDWVVAAGGGPDASENSLADFRAALAQYVRPRGARPFAAGQGACLLPVDTCPLSGTLFKLQERLGGTAKKTRREIQLDAGAYVDDHIKHALASLKELTPHDHQLAEGALLGVVVAHHPPTVTPTLVTEVKPFEIAIGAAQAKKKLFHQGFRVFLHGHKHMAVAHEEAVFPANDTPAEGILVLGATALLGNGGRDQGFSVVEYVVSPASGEARVLVHPHSLYNASPTPLERSRKLFYLPPRKLAPAGVIRVTTRIDLSGDGCSDYEYLEIPVPTGGEAEGGWKREGTRWVRSFGRHEGADLDVASYPRVEPLTQGVTAEVSEDDEKELRSGRWQRANRSFDVRVTAEPGVTHASFVERVFTHGAYAVSRSQQLRVSGTASCVPGLGDGWEGILHVMRDPARRLEFCVCMPMEHEYQVEVQTFTTGAGGAWVHEPWLAEFSLIHTSTNRPGRRIGVSIEFPLVGVAYLVRWRLPAETPTERGNNRHSRDDLRWAEACRREALRLAEEESQIAHRLLTEAVDAVVRRVIEVGEARSSADFEWSLFVPDRPLLHDGDVSGRSGRTTLLPVFASHARDGRWVAWEAGRGVAGRAYALGAPVEHVGAMGARYEPPPDQTDWHRPGIRIYQPVPGFGEHSVLYGLPVHGPSHQGSGVLWAVFCIGTRREELSLDLGHTIHPPDHLGLENAPRPAVQMFQAVLTRKFSSWLAGLR